MVKIERRYQYRSNNGIVWTSWYTYSEYSSKDQAELVYNELCKKKEVDKKLLGEYRIV